MRPTALPCCLPRLGAAGWAQAAALAVLAAAAPTSAGPPPPPRVAAEDVFQVMAPPHVEVALETDEAGRMRHHGDGFTAIIHPDGSLEFHDHRAEADVSILGVDPTRWRFKEAAPERHGPGWAAAIDRAIYPLGRMPLRLEAGARFGGLADRPHQRRRTAAKRAFLADTEALRLQLAHAWYRARLQAQLADLGGELAAIWRDPKLSLAERKRRIVRRWEECEEPAAAAPSQLDAMRVEAARVARAKIEAFVREVAPQGSPQAYTEAELEQYARERDRPARFRPYDPPVGPRDAAAGDAPADPPAQAAGGPSPLRR